MESEIIAAYKADQEKESNPYEIEITEQHALYVLYALHDQSKRLQESFHLNMLPEDTEYPFFGEKEAQMEARHLSEALHFAARRRLRQAFSDSGNLQLKDLDETAFVYLSSDKLLAWILLFPPLGAGTNLTRKQLRDLLESRGIVEGILEDALTIKPDAKGRYFSLHLVAMGTPAQKGKDGFVRYRYATESKITLEIGLRRQIDYGSLLADRHIKEGGILCDIVPPGEGTAGRTVTGEDVKSLGTGEEAQVPKGRHTAISEDGKYLIATKAGNVAYNGRSFQVKPVLELDEVLDAGTAGQINYLGDIHIRGDVCSGAVIRAMGDIQIDGTVEACTIEASENIIVAGGVQGQKEAVLQAHKGIYAKYLENCSVYARERVQADCLIECMVCCNGSVRVQTGRGVVIGGIIRSAKDVQATIIGSRAETKTEMILGGLPCDEAEQVQLTRELEKLTEELKALENEGETRENKAYLGKLRLNQCVLKTKLEKFKEELSVRSYDQEAGQVVSCETAYPGTSIVIGKAKYRVEKKENDISIGMKPNGKIGPI